MKNVLILGGGHMGSIVSSELKKDYNVEIADINNTADVKINIKNATKDEIKALYSKFDLVVGALPSSIGYYPVSVAAESGASYVDLSFMKEEVSNLDQAAKKNGSIIFHDCGLSPGLSNLIAGRINRNYKPSMISIMVGGVSQDPDAYMGHVNTWCTSDLLEEYTRPARFIIAGKERCVTPLNSNFWSDHRIEGVGELEGFITDGLRSLLSLKGPSLIVEITLRRKGHLSKARQLINQECFVETIEKNCSTGKDMVVLQVEFDQGTVTMIDRQEGQVSSMARTTAYSCASFAKLILEEKWKLPGVFSPESIGQFTPTVYPSHVDHFKFILNDLSKHGIKFNFRPIKAHL